MGYSRHQFIQMHIQEESRTRQVIRVVPWGAGCTSMCFLGKFP